MNLAAYRLISRALSPAYRVYLWRLGRKNTAFKNGREQRWGRFGSHPPKAGAIWVHAASVGEVRAAQSLIDRLVADGRSLYITTNTPTGLETLARRYRGTVEYGYAPVDVPGAVERFVDALSPAAAVFIELEIWPNRLDTLARRSVPVALINARLSAASLKRYQRLGALIKQSLRGLTCLCAQTEEDAQRFSELVGSDGPDNVPVSKRHIHITGNLKFDQPVDARQAEAGMRLRAFIGDERPVWVAASIRQGESELIGQAHQIVLEAFPDALLIAVPRHPERFKWPADGADGSGEVWDRHVLNASDLNDSIALDRSTRVLLGDTMGEMTRYLSAGDLAFVGGSLVPVGGHNPLEPAALGKPILMGPFVTNCQQIDALLGHCGGRIRVETAADLAQSVTMLLRDRHFLEQTGRNAQTLIEAHRGASERTLDILERCVLPPLRTPRADH
jgi:3-deoxy-D-manno-octulosonic-acid transferase